MPLPWRIQGEHPTPLQETGGCLTVEALGAVVLAFSIVALVLSTASVAIGFANSLNASALPSRPCPKPTCPNLSPCPVHAATTRTQRQNTARGGSGWTWQRTREHVLYRDSYSCRCDACPHAHPCGARATEVDHVIPIAEGGSSELHNLQALCSPCHQLKSAREARRRVGR